MGVYEYLYVFMGFYGCFWVSECLWVFMGVMCVYGCLWGFMDSRVSMDIIFKHENIAYFLIQEPQKI